MPVNRASISMSASDRNVGGKAIEIKQQSTPLTLLLCNKMPMTSSRTCANEYCLYLVAVPYVEAI